MSTTIELSPIVVDKEGTARIEGSRIKVRMLAVEHRQGSSVEEIQAEHPQLTRRQIAAALSYYYAHQEMFDAQIAQGQQEYEAARQAQQADPAHREWVETIRNRRKAQTDS